jgi:hypothetical protein
MGHLGQKAIMPKFNLAAAALRMHAGLEIDSHSWEKASLNIQL